MEDSEIINLISQARSGNAEAMDELLGIFRPKAVAISREYFLIGADSDDLIQYALIGLFKAINIFEPSKNNNFSQFASLCIHRELQNAVKLSTRKKNLPLNNYIPIKYYDGSDMDDNYLELVIVDDTSDIEENFLHRENRTILVSKIKSLLTSEELKVLKLFLNGEKYTSIAESLGLTSKKVDNMLQSIKKKLRAIKGEI